MAESTWEEVRLGDVASDVTVGFVGTMASEYVSSGVPFLRSLNIEPFLVNKDDLKFISHEFHQRLKKSALRPGDVVIVRTGKPGTAAVIPRWLADSNCSDLVVVRPGPKLDSRFLAYFVNGASSHHIDSHTVGAVQQHFNVSSAKTLPIPLPPLAEQRAIARVLGALDDKIELNRRLNRSLEELAQAVFRSWFVDFDPVTAKASGRPPVGLDPATAALFPDHFQDSELGEIPKGWELCSLYDTANYVNGAAFKGEDFCEPPFGKPVIKIVELKYGVTDQTKFTQRELKPDLLVRCGDLLYSWSGSPETSLDAYVWCANDGWLNQHIFKVVTESETQKVFVYYLLRYLRPFLVETARNKQTTGLGHVTVQDMKRLQVVRPPAPILTAFDRYAGSCFRQWFNNELQSRSLAAARDALLPPLLSGELRVPQAERLVGRLV